MLSPRPGYLVILPTDDERKSESGIIMTSKAEEKQSTVGIVLSAGRDTEVQVGEKVNFVVGASVYEKAAVEQGQKVFILPETNVLAIVGE